MTTPRHAALMFESSRARSLGVELHAELARRGMRLDRVRAWGPFAVALEATDPMCLVLESSPADDTIAQRFDTLVHPRHELPLIVVTMNGSSAERMAWLERGADDAVPPDIEAGELAVRVLAAARRTLALRRPRRLIHGPLVLNPESRTASWNGEDIALTATEFALLQCLVRGAKQAHSREALHAALGSATDERASNSLDVHVHALRRKLHPRLVRTVRGVGYRIGEASDLAG